MADQRASIPHLSKGEIKDLRGDVDAAFGLFEKRTGYPKISRVVGGMALSLGGLPQAAGIVGVNLIQGQVHASRTFGAGTSALTFTANRPGTPGNAITVELKTGAAEAISVVGTVIEVTLDTGVSTANSVKALVDGAAAAAALVNTTSGGAGVVAVAAAAALAGGVGEGLSVKVNGIEQAVTGATTETSIPMTVTALTGAAANGAVELDVESDGVRADALTLGVVA
jgi:hypothetical protein